jgi:hypothetical protein
MDLLVEKKLFRIPLEAQNAELGPKVKPPSNYFDVGSTYTIAPGELLLFSLPANHFNKRWDIHIPYQFDLPRGTGPRDENAWGGQPVMFLSYSFYDLPVTVQKSLKVAIGKPAQ